MTTADPTALGESGSPGPLELVRTHRTASVLVACAVLAAVLALAFGGTAWPKALVADPTHVLGTVNDWILDNRDSNPLFTYFFGYVSQAIIYAVHLVYLVLLNLGWVGVLAAAAGAGLWCAGPRVAATTAAALAVCGALGIWVATMQTLAMMIVAVLLSLLVGGALGVLAGGVPWFERALRPVLDTMQVLPAFAYLLPVVMVFGIGVPAAAIATVIYAVPPMVRLTALGLRGADPQVIEAVRSLGSTRVQRLLSARLPLARRQLMLGVNQTIMMALSMAVLGSVIGAGGLGDRVYQGLSTADVGAALGGGIGIVLLAVVLDRFTAGIGDRVADRAASGTGPAPSGSGPASSGSAAAASADDAGRGARGPFGRWTWPLAAVTVAVVVAGAFGPSVWPTGWTVSITRPVDVVVDWMSAHLYQGLPVVGGTAVWAGHFTQWIIDPIRWTLQHAPWWLLVAVAAAAAWLRSSWRAAASAVAALAVIGVLGVWKPALDTLSQVIAAIVLTLVLGVAIGVAAARSPRLNGVLRPVLDTLQTLPQFVYLIPVVALFGIGRAPAVAAAVLYGLPAVIRITAEGIRGVDGEVLEASESLGATRRQQLWKVQLPLARPALLVAVNQGIVLVLAVVIVGGLVGSGALGYQVVMGLSRGDLAAGLIGGVAIVCLGVLLDRTTQPAATGKGARR